MSFLIDENPLGALVRTALDTEKMTREQLTEAVYLLAATLQKLDEDETISEPVSRSDAEQRVLEAAIAYVDSYGDSTAENVLLYGEPRTQKLWTAVLALQELPEPQEAAQEHVWVVDPALNLYHHRFRSRISGSMACVPGHSK